MPVLRAVTEWQTRTGKRRRIRLYGAWRNLRMRCAGRIANGSGAFQWKGLAIGFFDWADFREWALGAGYSAINCSLDRFPDPKKGYFPSNLRWVTVEQNSACSGIVRMRKARAACQNP